MSTARTAGRSGLLAACAVFALLAAPVAASAADFSIKTGSGQEKRVQYFVTWTDDCGQGFVPKGGLSTNPAHGKVVFRRESFPIPKSASRGSVRDCSGRKVTGLGVYYTSERGYRGPDTFRMWIDNGGAASKRYSVAVTVE